MPTFRDCIMSAQKQGFITEDEASELVDRYQEHWEARRAAGHATPEDAAKSGLAAELDAASARKSTLAALAEQKRDELKGQFETFRNRSGKADIFEAVMRKLDHYGNGTGYSSVAGQAKARFNLAVAEMSDYVSNFRRTKLAGRRMNKPLGEDVIGEILGEASGKPEAAAMGQAAAKTFERLRTEFNAAGGNISKLDNYLPQYHNPQRVLSAGFEKWAEDIKPKLDLAKMRDPLTDGALSPDRLDATLRSAWEHITTGGWSDREPKATPFGLGSLANQRNEHRFLHFKGKDEWLAYNKEYGNGDPIEAIFQHIKGMTKDIAAMQQLGPNPNATVEWLKQVVQSEAGKFIAGKPSLHAGGPALNVQNKLNVQPWQIQSLYDHIMGANVPVSRRVGTFFGNTRAFLTSAQLGSSALLASVQDPFLDMAARHLSGIPQARALGGILHTFSTGTREQAVRAGFGLDDFAHIVGSEARYAGILNGGETTRWLADRTLQLSGLEPITQARKHLFGIDFAASLADSAKHSFDELANENPAMHRTMMDYGITAKDWEKMRATPIFRPDQNSAGLLRPMDVAEKDRGVAQKYLEMVLGQTERAVPTSAPRASSWVTGATSAGTITGELARSVTQYKGFTLSLMSRQLEALMMEARGGNGAGVAYQGAAMVARGAAYAGSLGFIMTIAGAAALQIKNIANGRDLEDMGPAFWVHALQYGGGLGLIGDFLLSDTDRFGNSMVESQLGPLYSAAKDVTKATLEEGQKAAGGRKTDAGRQMVGLLGRYTPVASSLWYIRAAYRRMFIDQLQYLADPDAHKHFRAQEQSLHRDTGQTSFWRPGQALPERMPEMSGERPAHR